MPERKVRALEIKLLHIGNVAAKGQGAGDDGAGRCAADEIEIIAEPECLAMPGPENRLDALEKRDRQRAAHPAAIQRKNALGAGAEKMTVAGSGLRRGTAIGW